MVLSALLIWFDDVYPTIQTVDDLYDRVGRSPHLPGGQKGEVIIVKIAGITLIGILEILHRQ